MGTSGAMNTSNQYIKYNITINQNSQNISNNTSNVSVYVNFWRTNSGYSTYGSGTVYCKINGTTYSAGVSTSQKITNSGITLFAQTLDIGHNSDGTKTLDTSAWITIDTPLSSSEQSYSQTLTTIPRKSSISSISGGTLGSSVSVSISRASSSFTHTVKYEKTNGTQTTVGTSIATSCTFTPPLSDSNYIPNSTTGTAKIHVTTYSGGTNIGTVSKSFTVSVPSSVIPTISSVSLSETVSGINAKFGGYVQNKSKIRGVVSASGSYNSTIKSYSSAANSQTFTASTFTTNAVSSSGSRSVTTTVKDSRGRTSAAKTTNYTVYPYSNPTITTFKVIRATSGGVADDQGTYALCTINAAISPVNNSNNKTFKIRYKEQGASNYTDINITPGGTTYNYNSSYLVPEMDINKNYNFVLELTDYFATVTKNIDLSTAFTLMDFNASGKGIALGKVSTQNKLEVGMAVEITGILEARGGRVRGYTVLYSNSSGTYGTITLSESYTKFNSIRVYFNDNGVCTVAEFDAQQNTQAVLANTYHRSGMDGYYIHAALLAFSGASATFSRNGVTTCLTTPSIAVSSAAGNGVRVTKIIGFY